MRKRQEKIGIAILAALILFSLVRMFVRNNLLKREGVFTLAHLSTASNGPDGWVYTFSYRVNHREFSTIYNGPIKSFVSSDSLIFVNLMLSDPSISHIVTEYKVPDCLNY